MLREIVIQLSDWSYYFVLLVGIISLIRFKVSKFFKLLAFYCIVQGFLYILTSIFAVHFMNNWPIYHVIGAIDILFAYLLFRELGMAQKWTLVFWIFLMGYFSNLIFVYYRDFKILNANPLAEAYFVNSLGLAISLLFVLLLGINFLWKIYSEEKIVELEKYPHFYIVGGFSIFAGGAFFIYLFSASFMPSNIQESMSYYSWIFIAGLTFIKYSMILIGLRFAKNDK